MSVWSDHKVFPGWLVWTPGPMIPTQVVRISGWIPPWFQANVWVDPMVLGRKTQLDRSLFAQGVDDDALRK